MRVSFFHISFGLLCWFFLGIGMLSAQNDLDFQEFKGQVVDFNSKKPLSEVQISVENSGISTMSNKNGTFSLKIPQDLFESVIHFSRLDYESKSVQLSFFDDYTEITLQPIYNLEEVELYEALNARKLVEEALSKQTHSPKKLSGFYRERIDRGRRNVMLGEAVLQIDMDKSVKGKSGRVSIYKSRKSTDYNRLDTLAVKLKGGAYSTLYLDMDRYPDFLFYKGETDNFDFSFEESTTINGRYVHVVYFEEVDRDLPWYYGHLFIDGKTNSLVRTTFSLNVENRKAAERFLVVHKPKRTKVTPLETFYQADYIMKDGEWHFNYGHFYILLRINWKGKLFNARYAINTELAITDRAEEEFFLKSEMKRLKPDAVLSDDISGFEDVDFWGANNVLHPDKSLEEVIEKIQGNLKKN